MRGGGACCLGSRVTLFQSALHQRIPKVSEHNGGIAILRAPGSLHPTAGAPPTSRAQVAELDISELMVALRGNGWGDAVLTTHAFNGEAGAFTWGVVLPGRPAVQPRIVGKYTVGNKILAHTGRVACCVPFHVFFATMAARQHARGRAGEQRFQVLLMERQPIVHAPSLPCGLASQAKGASLVGCVAPACHTRGS